MSQTTQVSKPLTSEEVEEYLELAHIDSEDDLSDFLEHFDIKSPEELDEFIQHYGILGMRWGVRRSDEELSRKRAGQITRNEITKKVIRDARSGRRHKAKVALGRAFIGSEQQNNNWDTLTSNLNAQNERIRSGNLTRADKWQIAMSTNIIDLLFVRTPKD